MSPVRQESDANAPDCLAAHLPLGSTRLPELRLQNSSVPAVHPRHLPLFSRCSHCIRCGSSRVHRLTKRDRVDAMSRHVFSLIQLLTFAPLNKCVACRLQYYDWRPPNPRV